MNEYLNFKYLFLTFRGRSVTTTMTVSYSHISLLESVYFGAFMRNGDQGF